MSERDADLSETELDMRAEDEEPLPGMAAGDGKPHGRRRRRKTRNILITLSLVILVPPLVLAGGLYVLSENYLGDIERLPNVFGPIPDQQRPDKPVAGTAAEGVTFLLAGVDTRAPAPTTGSQARSDKRGRTDALMLVHLTGDRQQVYVVSIPRDSWVPIPGDGHPDYAKINAAYAYGGPTLTVRTVEQLTEVRIDHFAIIDFAGFKDLTNALGGVTVTIPQNSYDSARNRHWQAGRAHLSGKEALAYVGQRHGLPHGDISRTHRQQQFLKAVLGKLLDQEILTDPLQLLDVVETITQTATVDSSLSNADLRGLAFELRNIRLDDVTLLTAPVAGFGRERGGQSVVYLENDEMLWKAFRQETLEQYLAKYGGDTLSDSAVN